MIGPEDPQPGFDWDSFRTARERFFARVRPEAMAVIVPSLCPDGVPPDWIAEGVDSPAWDEV